MKPIVHSMCSAYTKYTYLIVQNERNITIKKHHKWMGNRILVKETFPESTDDIAECDKIIGTHFVIIFLTCMQRHYRKLV